MANKKTVIIGASENRDRYAFKALQMLEEYGHSTISVGLKPGNVAGHPILAGFPPVADVDTVTLYVGPRNQGYWRDYILSLKPQRIIFNPGTESQELEQAAEAAGIAVLEACTLVMLRSGQY
jgi:uncharacterized protein